jgi:hypothetical protein
VINTPKLEKFFDSTCKGSKNCSIDFSTGDYNRDISHIPGSSSEVCQSFYKEYFKKASKLTE